MAVSNLNNYIDKIRNHETADMADVIKAQNYYSEHQQKNHSYLSGLCNLLVCTDEDIKLFCSTNNLFPIVSRKSTPIL